MALEWILLVGVPFLLGLVTGRWWALLLPLVYWAAWILGLNEGWWGYGVGDNWQAAMVGDGIIGAVCAVPGILLHTVARRVRTGEHRE